MPDINQRGDPSPFAMGAGTERGCLLLHGFTGAPAEMRPMGEYLAERGWRVRGPLLPGHGTNPDDLNHVSWQDWTAAASRSLAELRREARVVFVAGLSMGALLAAHLAAHDVAIPGILLLAPALRVANPWLWLTPVIRHLIAQFPTGSDSDLSDPEAPGRLWHYATYPVGGAAEFYRLQRQVRSELGRVTCPALIFASTRDGTLHPASAPTLFSQIGSTTKELVTLHESGHCMIVDSERFSIFAQCLDFMGNHISTTVR